MPARYSDNRGDIEAITKLMMQLVLQSLQSKGCETWADSLVPLASQELLPLVSAAAELYSKSTWVVQIEESEIRRFKLIEASDSESLTAPDDEADKAEPVDAAPDLPVESSLPLVHWSLASGANAVTHFHYAPWDADDPAATPLCRMRHREARPLRKPMIVGTGLQTARSGGPLCPDCARVVGVSLTQEPPAE